MSIDFERQLITALLPYINQASLSDAKMTISMICSKYEIQERHTELAIYTGDANAEMVARFLMAKAASGRSMKTIKYYKDSVTASLAKIGKKYDDITADDIRLYLAVRVQKDKVSKTTANNERRNLSAFYTWLQKEEILLKNPMAKVEVIKSEKKKKKAFTQMELEKIRNACVTWREKAIVEVLISTWARVSEVSKIQIKEINDGTIIVHGKGAKEREVFLNPKAQLTVETYLQERSDDNPYLFPRSKYAEFNGSKLKGASKQDMKKWYVSPDLVAEGCTDAGTIETIVKKLGKKANVENVHPHRFRRTGATMALQQGMELVTVSKILGHENIGTTQIYLDISGDDLKEAHKKYG